VRLGLRLGSPGQRLGQPLVFDDSSLLDPLVPVEAAVGQGYAKVTADLGQVRAAIIENLREPGRTAALRTMIGLSKARYYRSPTPQPGTRPCGDGQS